MTPVAPLDEGLLSAADQRRLAEVCARNRISRLSVFGSVARGEAGPDSDVDLLVDFEPGAQVSYLDLEKMASELGTFFGGRYVDIARPAQIHWFIRDRVMADARVLYAR